MALVHVSNIKGSKGDPGSFSNGPIPQGVDLNEFTDEGAWSIPNSTHGATLVNAPPAPVLSGVLTNLDAKNTVGIFVQYYDAYSSGGMWRRSTGSVSAQTWTSWTRIDVNTTVTVNSLEAAQRPVLVDAFRRRRGRVIGTAGKATLNLRFDHGLTVFNDTIVGMLEEYDLPAMNTMNARNWSQSSNNGMTQAEARAAWLNRGIEFTNHSATHQDASTAEAVEDEILGGLTELQEQFPESPIEMYTPPGVGGTRFMGFDGGDTLEKWYTTLAGKTILQHHAAASGYLPGIYRPLPANLDIGLAHYTMDQLSAADVEAAIRGVIAAKGSLTLMFHPVYLDQSGYLAAAELQQIFAYIASKRDAGEIEVLTSSGALLADPSSTHRHNLAENGDFTDGLNGWGDTTGWTVAEDGGLQWASTSTGAPLTQTVFLSRQAQYRGSNREVVFTVKTGVNPATVRAAVTNGGQLNTTKDYVVPAETTVDVRRPFSIPLNDGSSLDISVGRVSGDVSITNVRVQTI